MSASTQANQARDFPLTAWTVILSARDPAAEGARPAREAICRAYWRPVMEYLRTLGLKPEEAEDTAQTVLAAFCNAGWIERVNKTGGRLRHFFKAAARHALYDYRRDAAAAKRGGGAAPLAIDELPADAMPAGDAIADATFDCPWAWTLFSRALDALEQNYVLRGKQSLFEALKPALISTDDLQPYGEIGSQFGVKEPQIRIEVHRLRRRLAERLREEVAATLGPSATPADVEEETRYLVKVLAHERGG